MKKVLNYKSFMSGFDNSFSPGESEGGMVLGPELVVNGNFANWTGDNPDGWTVGGEVGSDPMITAVGGGCKFYGTGAVLLNMNQNIIKVGRRYMLSFDITEWTVKGSGGFYNNVYFKLFSECDLGRHNFVFTGLGNLLYIGNNATPINLIIDNVSVREIIELGE